MREIENSHKVKETVHYQSKINISLDIYDELKLNNVVPKRVRRMLGIVAIFSILGSMSAQFWSMRGSMSMHFWSMTIGLVSLAICVSCGLVYLSMRWCLAKEISRGLKTGKGSTAISHTVLFYDFGLERICDDNADDSSYFDYDTIYKILETQNTYVLFAKNKQIVVVDKASLFEDGGSECFARFLKGKCMDIKWCRESAQILREKCMDIKWRSEPLQEKRGVMRKILLTLLLLAILLPFLMALLPLIANHDSHRIMSIELGNFPDNVVYYVSEADYVDLTGATFLVEVRAGDVTEYDIYSRRGERLLIITDNVDFSTPGLYEVTIRWTLNDDLVGRIPIQVIEREVARGTVGNG